MPPFDNDPNSPPSNPVPDFTGLDNSQRNSLQKNGIGGNGFFNTGFGSLGGAAPGGMMPFALAPQGTWSHVAADILGAPVDIPKWGMRQMGMQPPAGGFDSNAWRNSFENFSAGTPAEWLGTPADLLAYLLHKVHPSVPLDVPLGTQSWQAMIDNFNKTTWGALAPSWSEIWQAARRVKP